MSKLKILIIEDDFSYASQLEKILAQDYEVAPIETGIDEALNVLDKENVDLIISDFFLKGNSTAADLMEKTSNKCIPVIIMTSSNDQTLYERSKGKNLLAYLIKPFDALTLKSTIDLAIDKMGLLPESIDSPAAMENQVYRDSFFIRTNKQLVKVIISDIRWIQSDGNYCVVVTQNRRYAIKLSLTKILKKLPPEEFIQAHKRYLVQAKYATLIDTNAGQLFIGEEAIPIGRKYKSKLFERLGWFI
jgi:DNA-binding LytR/AlgR family response regulator